jgi:hypothetical protein
MAPARRAQAIAVVVDQSSVSKSVTCTAFTNLRENDNAVFGHLLALMPLR